MYAMFFEKDWTNTDEKLTFVVHVASIALELLSE